MNVRLKYCNNEKKKTWTVQWASLKMYALFQVRSKHINNCIWIIVKLIVIFMLYSSAWTFLRACDPFVFLVKYWPLSPPTHHTQSVQFLWDLPFNLLEHFHWNLFLCCLFSCYSMWHISDTTDTSFVRCYSHCSKHLGVNYIFPSGSEIF